ncbi:acetylglutamate kinase [Enterococcus sp. HY326]|uniref:acetylglutamate kinase n=1 Tax=Enterococcus sp. HY326 TaxID=2971265 RepID=UPI00223EC6DE|nr:acetylglutamate kinase [Enterococcus sp. HY326]
MAGTIVIKMGGVASDNLTPEFFTQIRKWQAQGKQLVIVHGGGHYISEMMGTLNIPVEIKNGLRVTTAETLEITRMVLLGRVQPMITTTFQKADLTPIGLNAGCDQLIQGSIIDQNSLGFVGQVEEINTELIEVLLEKKHIPIIAPLGITSEGQWLNINADDVACKVASALQAEELFLLTDVPGIKQENQWLSEVQADQLDNLKSAKVITGGMIPKLESAKKALENGVGLVHISNAIDYAGTKVVYPAVAV